MLMTMNTKKVDDIAIVISGEAGQGLQTMERLLARVAKLSGRYVFTTSEFMSRVRGGNNSTLVRISSHRVDAALSRIDVFIPLNDGAVARFVGRITRDTIVFADPAAAAPELRSPGLTVRRIPYEEISKTCGGGRCLNVVICGFLCGFLGMPEQVLLEEVRSQLARLGAESLEHNLDAASKGVAAGATEARAGGLALATAPSGSVRSEPLLQGTNAIGIGALAGGCNFVSSYPMSPSSNLLEFLAKNAEDFDIAVEQAEDEIGAVNMACGSWYAGGRALVTTSGGGFSLMTEGLSLAGCAEVPLVIHLAQRPGPATGLPTRTEQGDLNLARFAGHGEFPRILYAPGDLAQGIDLACRAFNMADKYQVPVFVLTDQYFLDSATTIERLDLAPLVEEHHQVKTTTDYRRYRITDSGVSPRGIPGWGDGIVCVDSDEHTEGGYITEDFAVRTAMMDKRLRKLDRFSDDDVPPSLIGDPDYRVLLVGWGSILPIAREALRIADQAGVAFLHFGQLDPLPAASVGYLSKARVRVVVENNATGQFGMLIEEKTGLAFDARVLNYDGRQFTVEDLAKAVREAVRS